MPTVKIRNKSPKINQQTLDTNHESRKNYNCKTTGLFLNQQNVIIYVYISRLR